MYYAEDVICGNRESTSINQPTPGNPLELSRGHSAWNEQGNELRINSLPFFDLITKVVHRRRLEQHNAGENRSTAKLRPWKVVLYVAFETRFQACRFERYLKSGSGHAGTDRHFWS
jgi:hypothetical protein